MKSLTRPLILALAVCCTIGAAQGFAGSRSFKGGSGKSSPGNRSTKSNGNSSQNRFQFRSSNNSGRSNQSNFGRNRGTQLRSGSGSHISQFSTNNKTTSKIPFSNGGHRNLHHVTQNNKTKVGSHFNNSQQVNQFKHLGQNINHGNRNLHLSHNANKHHGLQLRINAGHQHKIHAHQNHNWKHLVLNAMRHNRHHWCHTRPATCHWWASYCTPIAHYHSNQLTTCNFHHVSCKPVLHFGVSTVDVQWYLGMKGIVLPGKGIGIEAVEQNSPAALAGLQPGMVITVCNGIQLIDEASMREAIRISGGVLNMTLLSSDGTQVLEGGVQMTQVSRMAF